MRNYEKMKKSEMNFEKAMEKLAKTVGELESGDLSLEESLKKFEEAVSLVRFCSDALENAKQKVRVLTEGGDGQVTERDFTTDDEA